MNEHLIDPLEYGKYDKITDMVFPVGLNCSLKFNVSLSKNYNNSRMHFHREFEYKNSKYGESLVTLKREYDYYFSLENNTRPENTDKCFIRIGANEYYRFMNALDTAKSWFEDKKYSKLFQVSGEKIIMTAPIPSYRLDGLPMDKYLEFNPVIIQKGQSDGDCEPGISITLSDERNIVYLTLDRLMGLHYTVSTYNMILSAQNMINYLGRPDFGTNRIYMDSDYSGGNNNAKEINATKGVDGRQIPGLIKKG